MRNIGLVQEISTLTDATVHYTGEMHFFIVSIHYTEGRTKGAGISRLNVTDFSRNRLLGTDKVRQNHIGDFGKKIDIDKMMQLHIFNNKLESFLESIEHLTGQKIKLEGNRYSCFSIAHLGIFAKADIEFKMWQGCLEGFLNSIELLDLSRGNVNKSLPLYKNVLESIDRYFIERYLKEFGRTIPVEMIERHYRGQNSYISPTPYDTAPPSSPERRSNNNINNTTRDGDNTTQASADNQADTSPLRSPQIKLTSEGLPDDDTYNKDFHSDNEELPTETQPPTPTQTQSRKRAAHTQVRSTSEERPKPKHTLFEMMNNIRTIDDKIIRVDAVIVEFEPLMNQLCVKYDANKQPVLNPLAIVARGSTEDMYPEEEKFLRISFTTPQEIFNFLGMDEIEEVYIKTKEIYAKFDAIVSSKTLLSLKVARRKIKVNNYGNSIYGWELVGMTLYDLYNQCI